MPNPILFLNQPYMQVGLGTLTFTISNAGLYNVACQCTVPSAPATGDGAGSGGNGSQGPVVTSGVVIRVTQNGTTVYTSQTLGVAQSAFQFKTDLSCATSDAITVVISSSTASDEQLNAVQTVVSVNQGI